MKFLKRLLLSILWIIYFIYVITIPINWWFIWLFTGMSIDKFNNTCHRKLDDFGDEIELV